MTALKNYAWNILFALETLWDSILGRGLEDSEEEIISEFGADKTSHEISYVDLGQEMVVFTDGSAIPITAQCDEEGFPVVGDRIPDIIIAGTDDLGFWTIRLDCFELRPVH